MSPVYPRIYVLFLLLLFVDFIFCSTEVVSIGVIHDNIMLANISRGYMEMARYDFYQAHPHYITRLGLHYRDPKDDVVDAATAAVDLIENDEVESIIGPTWSTQTRFLIELGRKAQVPIISYSATSPSLSPTQNPFFVRTAYDDSSQVKAIAAVIQAFGWREIAIIYEDSEYGNGLISYLTDAFQSIYIRVPYRSAISPSSPTLEVDILKTLHELLRMQTRVFLVHMTGRLGSRFFIEAKESQMLNEDFAWIVTDGLSTLLDPVIKGAAFAMEGVVGVRPFISIDKKLEFSRRRDAYLTLLKYATMELNLFGFWAYDTVTALAMVVEKVWKMSNHKMVFPDSLNFSGTTTSKMGSKILQGIRNIRIADGLSGDFEVVNGQLQPRAFDVFNVVGGEERVIGHWTLENGLSKDMTIDHEDYSTSKEDLEAPIWPGGTRKIPKGWVVSVKGDKQMKIGVPVRAGFQEFFRIEWDRYTNEPTYSGFAYDMFLAVKEKLPFDLPCKFIPFMNENRQSNGTFSEMLDQINRKKVDAVVGDTTITANRSESIDFTLPYSESGVRMLVAIKEDNRHNIWIFLKPLSLELWLTTVLAFLVNGLVVSFLERHNNEDFNGTWHERLPISIWFSFCTLVFAHRERILSNWTRLVLVVWVFMVLIITQSYTANLASFLTIDRLQPKHLDVEELKSNGLRVGYQKTAFVKDDILIRLLGFSNESLLIPFESVEQYHDALSNGSVAAIFDEIPYIRLFLAKYCDKFMMVGPTYKSDGFGFAFPLNSPLVPYFSRAILSVTENKIKMDEIENRNNLSRSLCRDQSDNAGAFISSDNASLGLYCFGGLFLIVAAVSIFSLIGEFIQTNGGRIMNFMRDGIVTLGNKWNEIWQKIKVLFRYARVLVGYTNLIIF